MKKTALLWGCAVALALATQQTHAFGFGFGGGQQEVEHDHDHEHDHVDFYDGKRAARWSVPGPCWRTGRVHC